MHWRRSASRFAAMVAAAASAGVLATSLAGAADATDAGTPSSAGAASSERIARQLEQANSGVRAVTEISPPPDVTATGWLVYDVLSAEPIAGVEAATPRPIASLAKLMTALVVVERVELDETVKIPASVNELSADASRMDARPGEEWPAADLLRAMLAHSANDAAIALAAHVADGDQGAFVELMNERAKELGLADTEFASPTGLDAPGEASTSTPIDLVTLATAALREQSIAAAVAEEEVTLKRPGGGAAITLPNRNPLLGAYPGVDGVKTGFTDAAGYMLVVHHVDAETSGDVAVVTFASTSEATRVSDARALLDWARSLRQPVRVIEGGTPYGSIPVQRSSERIEVFACDDLVVTARVGQSVTQEVVVPRSVAAPVVEGDEVGEVRLQLGTPVDEEQAQLPPAVPLCSGTAVRERDRVERALDYAKDWRSAWGAGVDEVEDAWSALTGEAA